MPLSDIEIARQSKMRPIDEVAAKIGISRDQLLQYGPYKAKLSLDAVKSLQGKKTGKLVLVTAITPTPAGEGKTTTTVGLGDGCQHRQAVPDALAAPRLEVGLSTACNLRSLMENGRALSDHPRSGRPDVGLNNPRICPCP